MPSGKNHDRITWICLPIIVLATLIFSQNFILSIFVALAFVFSGLMFGPDLDIYSIQYKRWGWFKFIWLPYQKTLKHRSWFSHGFLIGTIVRILYLSVIILILSIFVVAIAQMIFGFNWHWQQILSSIYSNLRNKYTQQAIAIFIGLELGAMSHYVADEIGSRIKASSKKKKANTKKKSRRRKTRSKS